MGNSRNLFTVRSGSPGRLRLTAFGNSSHSVVSPLERRGRTKHGHDLLYAGAELRRPYPGCISTTSDHAIQRNDEASEGRWSKS